MNWSVIARFSAFVVIGLVFVGSWVVDGSPNSSLLRFASTTGFVLYILFLLWEYLAWRWPLVQRLPHVPRDVRGTWKGALHSQWIDPKTGWQIPAKTVYLVVRQSASKVSATLLTDESKSTSSLAKVSELEGGFELHYIYFNKPSMRFEDRSRMHHGSTVLEVVACPAKRLTGRYWTDRDSKGELDFTERKVEFPDDYAGAVALWDS